MRLLCPATYVRYQSSTYYRVPEGWEGPEQRSFENLETKDKSLRCAARPFLSLAPGRVSDTHCRHSFPESFAILSFQSAGAQVFPHASVLVTLYYVLVFLRIFIFI